MVGGKDAMLSSGLIGDSYASRIRNGNITMVHTWDWTPRTRSDTVLPGKKVRAPGRRGVGPVALECGCGQRVGVRRWGKGELSMVQCVSEARSSAGHDNRGASHDKPHTTEVDKERFRTE